MSSDTAPPHRAQASERHGTPPRPCAAQRDTDGERLARLARFFRGDGERYATPPLRVPHPLAPRSTPRAFRGLCKAQGLLPALRVLTLSPCASPAAEGADDDAERGTHGVPAATLTDGSLRYVARLALPPPHARTELSGLLALDLSGCGHVTDDGVARVARGLHRPTFPLPSTAADGNGDHRRAQGASACSPCGCPGAPRSPTPAALTWQVPSPRHTTPHPLHRPHRTALRSLRSLDLSATDITDEGVRRLRGVQDRLPLFFSLLSSFLSSLLFLSHPFPRFPRFPPPLFTTHAKMCTETQLEAIDLSHTAVTDEGVFALPRTLRELTVRATRVTNRAVRTLVRVPPPRTHRPADRFALRHFDGSLTEVTPLRVDWAVRTLRSERQVLGVAREGALRFSVARRFSTPSAARLLAPTPLNRRAQRLLRSFLCAAHAHGRDGDGDDEGRSDSPPAHTCAAVPRARQGGTAVPSPASGVSVWRNLHLLSCQERCVVSTF